MSTTVTRQDARYDTLRKSRNLRWPSSGDEFASEVDLCDSEGDVAEVLQRVVSAGMRPTVRSGGHCYEDFVVNNPNGAIIDLSLLKQGRLPDERAQYTISAGQVLGEVYLDLYKRHGVTIPAGTCYGVGAGGHISGGGYGVLSRLHGLTVDWLSAVNILTVDAHGKVVRRRVSKENDPDLFKACRGAGGGSFGIITSFHCDKLPPAPQEIVEAHISFDWKDMTEARFIQILQTYGHYWETRGKDPDTWGLFAGLGLSHSSSGRLGIGLQFCNPDGTCKDLSVVNEFLDLFQHCKPIAGAANLPGDKKVFHDPKAPKECVGDHEIARHQWLEATIGGGGGGGEARTKYKSCYMKRNFTTDEAKIIYKRLTQEAPGVDLRGFVLSVDSYGGATNKLSLADETSRWQRSSVMKLQYQYYWRNAGEDDARLKWLHDLYADIYSTSNVDPRYTSTPYPGEYYEGCYINYPDADMLKYPFWTGLYYGDQYPFLQGVKRKYDPNNIFHHAMSVRA